MQLNNTKKISIKIRRAKKNDIGKIISFINSTDLNNKLIRRKRQEIENSKYYVATRDDRIIGCIAYKIWPNQQIEIISLIVKKNLRNIGIGKKLLAHCLSQIKKAGYSSAFALTGVPYIFEKYNFVKVKHKLFPEKIWSDCRMCPKNIGNHKNPKCHEVPMYKIFDSK